MTIINSNIIRYHFNKYFKTYNRLCTSWSLGPTYMAVPCELQPCICLKGSFSAIQSDLPWHYCTCPLTYSKRIHCSLPPGPMFVHLQY